MPRLLRRILVLLVVLGGLFVAANIVAANAAETRVARALQKQYRLPTRPTVSIDAFPLLLRLVTGTIPRITFSVVDARFERFTLQRVDGTLNDLSVKGGLIGGGHLAVSVRTGSIRGRATQDAVNAFIRARGENATVSCHAGSVTVRTVRTLAGRRHTVVATGPIERDGNKLRFIARRATVDGAQAPPVLEAEARRQASFAVSLPALPGGTSRYTFRSVDGALEARGDLAGQTFSVTG